MTAPPPLTCSLYEAGFRAQLAVLVKPNGLFGRAYMAAIRPFRHLVVHPAMMREGAPEWRARTGDAAPARAEGRVARGPA